MHISSSPPPPFIPLLYPGKRGRQYCGHPEFVDAFKNGKLEIDSSKDDEVELRSAKNHRATQKRLGENQTENNDDDVDEDSGKTRDDVGSLNCAKRKASSSTEYTEIKTEDNCEEVKRRRLNCDERLNIVNAAERDAGDVCGSVNVVVVKRERDDSHLSPTPTSRMTANSNIVELPRVKVLREIEDPTASRGGGGGGGGGGVASGFTPILSPDECIEPILDGERLSAKKPYDHVWHADISGFFPTILYISLSNISFEYHERAIS